MGLWLDDGGRPSKASRLHARFDRLSTTTPCSWRLVDNDSANGTFVNGVRIPQDGVELRDGDCIGFGSVPPPPASESSEASDVGVVSKKVHASDVARAAAATSDATPRFHYVIRFRDGPSHSVVTAVASATTTKGDVKPAAPNPAHAASNPAVRPPPTYEQRPSARRPHSAKSSAAASSVVNPVTSIANAPAAAAALDSAELADVSDAATAGAPPETLEAAAAASPAAAAAAAPAPGEAAAAAPVSAFEAGEKATLLSLLGCMRAQLRASQAKLKDATAAKEAATLDAATLAATHRVCWSALAAELRSAETDGERLAERLAENEIRHAVALAAAQEETESAARAVADAHLKLAAARQAAAQAEVSAAVAVGVDGHGGAKEKVATVAAGAEGSGTRLNQVELLSPRVALGWSALARWWIRPGSDDSNFDLSRRLLELKHVTGKVASTRGDSSAGGERGRGEVTARRRGDRAHPRGKRSASWAGVWRPAVHIGARFGLPVHPRHPRQHSHHDRHAVAAAAGQERWPRRWRSDWRRRDWRRQRSGRGEAARVRAAATSTERMRGPVRGSNSGGGTGGGTGGRGDSGGGGTGGGSGRGGGAARKAASSDA